MADPRVKILENLPGSDDYGTFVIERIGYKDDGGLRVRVRYDSPGSNPATYWYYNTDGSMYQRNPDGSSTYKSASGTLIHRPYVPRTRATPSIVCSGPPSVSLPFRATGLLFLGWPMILVYPGYSLVFVSMNVFFLFLLLSVCAFLSQKD